jgi:hypothetical protein
MQGVLDQSPYGRRQQTQCPLRRHPRKDENAKESSLSPSGLPFYGVILGKKMVPLGRIRLHMTFDELNNFRKDPLTLEMVDFPSTYHALLG